MAADILDDARLFLIQSLKGKSNLFETVHPWRKDWEFTVLHSHRVETITLKILAREAHLLTEHEIFLLRLAAVLHDLSRLEPTDHHALIGAELARKWLQVRARPSLDAHDIVRVVEMIADHSNKKDPEPDFSKAVLKDADTLDEIGAMSIFMAGNWLDQRSPFFFYDLRQRLIEVEIPFCDEKFKSLNTGGAKEILREKKVFIENFIRQMADEIQTMGQMEEYLLSGWTKGNERAPGDPFSA